MKQWRQKWTDRDAASGNLVQIIGAAQERIAQIEAQTPEKKTRNIEMVDKKIVKTAQNWNPKNQQNENEILVTPTKPTSAEKKLVSDRDILKERSPQPQRFSPKKDLTQSSGKKHQSPVITSAERLRS